jgi:DNA helicase II / ATP-dependent DNA helicase PcrA
LASDQDELAETGSGVRLMTVHAAKGLEFPNVFIAGLEQGLFPHDHMGAHSHESGTRKIEEERRLFYVAMTRAGKRLFLSFAEYRQIFGSISMCAPSQFIEEIPAHLIDAVYETSETPSRSIWFD